MADNSFNGTTESRSEPRTFREKKVLHALEQYLTDTRAAAEAEVKRHPLDYTATLLLGAVAASVAEHYGVNHTLSTLVALAGVAAGAGTAVAIRRQVHYRKAGLNLPLLSDTEKAALRRIALGFANILAELGRRFKVPALIALAAALIIVVNLTLPVPGNSSPTLLRRPNVAELSTATPSMHSDRYPGLRWTVAYNPPTYTGQVTTVTVNSLYPWPGDKNA